MIRSEMSRTTESIRNIALLGRPEVGNATVIAGSSAGRRVRHAIPLPRIFFMRMVRVLLLSLIATTTLAEKIQPVPGPNKAGPAPTATRVGVEESCGKVPPDAKYFIPESFKEKKMPSGTGFYGYQTSSDCPLWVVDFSMNSESNSVLHSGTRIWDVTNFSGDAYDLPSSAARFGFVPAVAEDCRRYSGRYMIYTKMKHEATFNFVKKVTWQGQWVPQSNQCDVVFSSTGDTYTAPKANVRVVRVAVGVLLRSSFQEAAAIARDGPPR